MRCCEGGCFGSVDDACLSAVPLGLTMGSVCHASNACQSRMDVSNACQLCFSVPHGVSLLCLGCRQSAMSPMLVSRACQRRMGVSLSCLGCLSAVLVGLTGGSVCHVSNARQSRVGVGLPCLECLSVVLVSVALGSVFFVSDRSHVARASSTLKCLQ